MPRIDLWVGPGLISAQASTGCAWSMTTPRLRTALVRESELPQARRHPPRQGRHYAPVPKPSFARPALLPDPDIHAVTDAGVSSADRGVAGALGSNPLLITRGSSASNRKDEIPPLDRAESTTVPAPGRVVRLATCCRFVIGAGRRGSGGDTPRGPHRGWGPRVSVRR